ncbi:MAG TPA: gamma-glutamyltransferase, partial [Verrucomicrobiae bacterium]|nr:gamma-glutamyltransferase [Verrucomicrobiae bacterium]
LMVPGRGFFLNNELTDFDAQPRDAEGRLAANAAGPGKRPRSSMSPTLVFKKDGRPVMIVGSPGGSKIIGAVLNVIVNVLDYGMTLDEALKSPRVINRDGPVELEAPLSGNAALKKKLAAQGLKTELAKPLGNVQAIVFQEGQLIGGSDPRGNGAAEGYGEF